MAHVIYDKATSTPLMIVLNPSPTHEAHLNKLCENEPNKGLHIISEEKYKEIKEPKEIAAAIVEAVAEELND